MTSQMSLFDRPVARRRDPETSHKAAQKAMNFAPRHEATIFGAICETGEQGATAKEISRSTGLTDVQVNRRLKAMGDRNLIVRTGEHREGCCAWRKA